MKTYMLKNFEIKRKWYIIDATDQILGRLSTIVSSILRGKYKPIFTSHIDTGDNVIIVNAEKIKLTGNKENKKLYRRHTGYVGNLKTVIYKDMLNKHPERIIRKAIKGMIPHNVLGRKTLEKLHVYKGSEHPHKAQNPEIFTIKK